MKNRTRLYGVLGLVALVIAAALLTHFDGATLLYAAADPSAHQGWSLHIADAGAAALTIKDIEELQKKLGDVTTQVQTFAEDIVKQTKAGKELTDAVKAEVDKVLSVQGELRNSITELATRQGDAERKLADLAKAPANPAAPLSPGEQFINDEKVKAFMEGGFKSRGRVRMDLKAITTVGFTGLVVPQRVDGIIALPERRMTVRDLLTPGRTNSNSIQYWQETGFTNNAEVVSETVTKPESTITGELVTANVATIAHVMIAAKQILDDAPALQSHIDGRLRYGLAYAEEQQLLLGDGTGVNILGIIPQASAFSAPFQPEFMQRIDTVRLAILQSELALFPATGIVVHPTDWARIELTKDADGRYIFATPQNLADLRLWSRPVVATPALTERTFVVGAFRLGAQIFDREDANVEVSTEDGDNFRKNLITIRGEERVALAVYRPEAFITGQFQATT